MTFTTPYWLENGEYFDWQLWQAPLTEQNDSFTLRLTIDRMLDSCNILWLSIVIQSKIKSFTVTTDVHKATGVKILMGGFEFHQLHINAHYQWSKDIDNETPLDITSSRVFVSNSLMVFFFRIDLWCKENYNWYKLTIPPFPNLYLTLALNPTIA